MQGPMMASGPRRRAVLIAGPTASGKSRRALRLAEQTGGVVINTDALQVYDGLRVLTARPSCDEIRDVPHRLYGMVPPDRRFSTGAWLTAATALITDPALADRPLIFVGGTGLYFEALTNGFAPVPQVPVEVTAAIEAELAGLNAEARGRILAERDPVMAARLPVPDPQRVTRALAVLRATGRSLAEFQDRTGAGPLSGFAVDRLVLNPPRDVLAARIARRFETMLDAGAAEEVRALGDLGLDPSLPVMKAIGRREIADWLAGRLDRDAAVERAVIATRQYAKRQRTWFRNRMADWQWPDLASETT